MRRYALVALLAFSLPLLAAGQAALAHALALVGTVTLTPRAPVPGEPVLLDLTVSDAYGNPVPATAATAALVHADGSVQEPGVALVAAESGALTGQVIITAQSRSIRLDVTVADSAWQGDLPLTATVQNAQFELRHLEEGGGRSWTWPLLAAGFAALGAVYLITSRPRRGGKKRG